MSQGQQVAEQACLGTPGAGRLDRAAWGCFSEGSVLRGLSSIGISQSKFQFLAGPSGKGFSMVGNRIIALLI